MIIKDQVIDRQKKREPMSKVWILATVIGLVFVTLILYQYRGVSVVLITGLALYIAYTNKREAALTIDRKFYAMSIYAFLISLTFSISTVTVIRFFSGLILIAILITLNFSEKKFLWTHWVSNFFTYLVGAMAQYDCYFRVGTVKGLKKHKQLKQVILGLIIAIPLLIIVLTLLSGADAVFDEMVGGVFDHLNDFFDIFDDIALGEYIWRIMMLLFIAPMIYGMNIYLKKKVQLEEIEKSAVTKKHYFIAPTVSATVLVLLNVIYLLFAYVQIRFLFLGDFKSINYDHAQYARDGFFELVVMSILNTLGILFINAFTKPHKFNKIALSITVACTHVMIASSAYKMYLYESTYGYTQQRLYVYFILVFLVIFMVLVTVNIWQPSFRAIEYATVIALSYFLVISYVNVDRIIVEKNVERYEMTYNKENLDFWYLTSLSEDAIPSLVTFVEKDEVDEFDFNIRNNEERYARRLEQVISNHEERSFFEYNIRHQKAYKAAIRGLLLIE